MNGRQCSLRLTRRYADSPAEVWKALTDPASVARWLAPGFDLQASEVEPGRVLELDWRPPGEVPSVVRFVLTPDGEGTILVLDHARIEARAGMAALRYWVGALARVPLRERT
ncbi:MAG TPA: hypothetical protein VJT84_03740 [Gaiellaceae bacterium]|nr:hypothetical protein [Gaiellaceae bacterium]